MNRRSTASIVPGFGWGFGITCIVIFGSWRAATGAEELVITREDLLQEAGTRTNYSTIDADGKTVGRWWRMITANENRGDYHFVRQVVIQGETRGPELMAIYSRTGAILWSEKMGRSVVQLPLPLSAGRSVRHEEDGRVLVTTAEKSEEVSVPAGKFRCLVCVTRAEGGDGKPVAISWMAPGIGMVQTRSFEADREMTSVLVSLVKPAAARTPPNAAVFSNFDSGDPLSSPLFPRGRWIAAQGGNDALSHVEIDPQTGAEGSAMSLRWNYHCRGTWAAADMLPGGSWRDTVDLSIYDSMTFHVKALKAGKVEFQLHGRQPAGDGTIYVPHSIELTTEWKQHTIDLQAPEWAKLDMKKICNVRFVFWSREYDSNVGWIDQISLHKKSARPD